MNYRVAALYTLGRSSPYASIPGVDYWPARRDAFQYRGPWPVIAHPPCGPWSRSVAHQTHFSIAQSPHLACHAVHQVQEFSGILEHPAGSMLWKKMSLPYPEPYRQATLGGPRVDAHGGFTIEVFQGSWGHCAPKRTWLYMVGVDPDLIRLPPDPPSAGKSKSLRIDKRTGSAWYRLAYDLGSAESRKRTPLAFAEWLVNLAASASQSAGGSDRRRCFACLPVTSRLGSPESKVCATCGGPC